MDDLYDYQCLIRAKYEMLTKAERKAYQLAMTPKRIELYQSHDWEHSKDPGAGAEFCRKAQSISLDTLEAFGV